LPILGVCGIAIGFRQLSGSGHHIFQQITKPTYR